MTTSKYDLLDEVLAEAGEASFRRKQVLRALFVERRATFAENSTLPKALALRLEERFGPSFLELEQVERQIGGQADKLLFGMADGERCEAVHLLYRKGFHSYCVSSQVGCGYGCTFCSTGAIGLKRNMTADEMTDQILFFHLDGLPIDSISFMGMGEALSNPHFFRALEDLTNPDLFGLGARRITVSTIGLPKQMRRMTAEHPQVNLTLSLHSPFPDQRSEIMPINDRHPLDVVLDALDDHVAATNRKVYLAYVLMHGVNDSLDHADAVAELVRARPHPKGLYHVNLIRYNDATFVDDSIHASREARINAFVDRLREHGTKVTVRQSFGTDIDAACGQLYAEYDQRVRSVPVALRPSPVG